MTDSDAQGGCDFCGARAGQAHAIFCPFKPKDQFGDLGLEINTLRNHRPSASEKVARAARRYLQVLDAYRTVTGFGGQEQARAWRRMRRAETVLRCRLEGRV